jgi:hypothetical protein
MCTANSGATANVANNGFYSVNTAFAGRDSPQRRHNRTSNGSQGATPGAINVK